MKEKFAELPEVLKEFWLGILISGGIMEVVFVWFWPDKWLFTTGLWSGIVEAVFMAWHMYRTLDDSLYMADADRRISKGYAKRYFVTFASALVIYWLEIGSYLAFFLGVLSLKFGAYLQPAIHRFVTEKKKGG